MQKYAKIEPKGEAGEGGKEPSGSLVSKLRRISVQRRNSMVNKALLNLKGNALSAPSDSIQDDLVSIFVFPPEHWLRLLWDLILYLFAVYQMVLLPYLFAFSLPISGSVASAEVVTIAVFLIDIGINFNTGYYFHGDLVLDRQLIAKHYIQTWLWMDVFSSFPFSWCASGIDPPHDPPSSRYTQILARILPFFYLFRAVRLVKLKEFLRKTEDLIANSTTSTMLVLVRLGLLLLLLAHWVACLWYYLVANSEFTSRESWILAYTPSNNYHSNSALYVTALYWAFTTMTTVGYGDICPETTTERIFVSCVMMLSCIVFAYCMGEISSLVAKESAIYTKYRSKVIMLNGYMRENRLPGELQYRVRRYIEHEWGSKEDGMEAGEEVMDVLSEPLKDEVFVQVYGGILHQYSFFKDYPFKLIALLCRSLTHESFSPSDPIFQEGTLSTSLYFIIAGKVDIFHESTKSSYGVLKRKAYFGEIGFLMGTGRCASARCVEFAQVLTVDRTSFTQNLSQFPSYFSLTNQLISHSLSGDLSSLRVHCYMCKELGHIAKSCKLLLSHTDAAKNRWLWARKDTKYISPVIPNKPNYERSPKKTVKFAPIFAASPTSSGKLKDIAKSYEESAGKPRINCFSSVASLFGDLKDGSNRASCNAGDVEVIVGTEEDEEEERGMNSGSRILRSNRREGREDTRRPVCEDSVQLHVIEESSAGSEV